MNIKELNRLTYSNCFNSETKKLKSAVFYKGYYLSKLKNKLHLGKPTTILCSDSHCKYSDSAIHNPFNCRTCLRLNYNEWKKVPIKDGFYSSYCGCGHHFNIPLERHVKKSNFLRELRYSEETVYEVVDIDNECCEVVPEEEAYVTLADFI